MDIFQKYSLHIRYTRLYFFVVFLEDTRLPENKPSAIRGGIGEMLLRSNCIRDRNCEVCDFKEECIVQRTMYTQFKEKPAYVTTGDSVGYVLSCENRKEYFQAGDGLEFEMLLFGRNLVYFSQYIQAIYALGMNGLGKYKARFRLVYVKNADRQDILKDGQIYMERYQVRYLDQYVEKQLKSRETLTYRHLKFFTPLTLKYQGEFLKEFQMDAILAGIRRRIYMLDCFEGIQDEEWMRWKLPNVEIKNQRFFPVHVERYSSRRDSRMILKGLAGEIFLDDVPEEVKGLLLAGELIHVGKNTSFGFGRYEILD